MRIVSILIPYYLQDDKLFVLMQLRSLDAERIPGYISFFGGGVDEGETPDQGLIREIKEELDLDLDLDQVEPFHKYEFYETVNHFYLLTSGAWLAAATSVRRRSGCLAELARSV